MRTRVAMLAEAQVFEPERDQRRFRDLAFGGGTFVMKLEALALGAHEISSNPGHGCHQPFVTRPDD
jgi:hypothetical protein